MQTPILSCKLVAIASLVACGGSAGPVKQPPAPDSEEMAISVATQCAKAAPHFGKGGMGSALLFETAKAHRSSGWEVTFDEHATEAARTFEKKIPRGDGLRLWVNLETKKCGQSTSW